MEELFSTIANALDDGTSWSYDAPMTHEMMDDAIARVNGFFDDGSSLGMEWGGQNVLGLEGTSHFGDDSYGFKGFEDSFFNPAQFEGMGLSSQDALDLLLTHVGTQETLHHMETHFNAFQEELCCDYMAGVRAAINGMDISQMEQALSEIPQQMGHADGSFRVEAFADGFAFGQGFVETHGQQLPTFNDSLEGFSGEHMQDLADLARLGDQLYAQECEMAHYRGLVEAQPGDEMALQQYDESLAKYNALHAEYEQKLATMGEGSSFSEIVSGHGNWPVEGEYHLTFGHKDNLFTKSEIEAHKHKAQNEIDYQKSRIEHLKKELAYAGSHEAEKSKISSLRSSLDDATGKLSAAKSNLKAWENTKPKA